jgi:hypothetical protein
MSRPLFRFHAIAAPVCLAFFGLAVAAQATTIKAVAPIHIDGVGKGSVSLDGPWQFHLGDDPSFATPGIDDATGHNGWEQLTADKPWGLQGHPSYVGLAWYRKHIDLTPAPGAPADIALFIPHIDDAYELYWNGARIGGLGSLPPRRIDAMFLVPPQTYGLGPIRSGVLAVRVYKATLSSVDDGAAGGFEVAPQIGSPQAIGLLKTASDYRWLQRRQFHFGLVTLYTLASILSFFAWLRDRRQKLLFWVAAFTFIPMLELISNGLRVQISGLWDTFFIQTAIQLREACQWFLLVYLLQLENSQRLMRNLRIFAWITILFGALDGALSFCYDILTVQQFAWIDALLTVVILLAEPIPVILVLIALFRRQRLDHTRWLVAFFAFAGGIWYTISNYSLQGIRYTHWSIGVHMEDAIFTIFGSNFPMGGIIRILLFLSILYAVLRYAADHRRRQIAVEQELQAARELQQVLVPEALPDIPGFTLTTAYKPAQEVGGDFFQVIALEDGPDTGATLILLGDVSGKGLKAAMTVSLLVGAIRMAAEVTSSPATILNALNRRLHGRMEHGFATCIALLLTPGGQCQIASAGHTSPYLNGQEILLPGAFPLGLLPDTAYEEETLTLPANSQLSLYTDGLLEARNAAGELYGFERLNILFNSSPTATRATEEAVAFGQDDDITVLTLTRILTHSTA